MINTFQREITVAGIKEWRTYTTIDQLKGWDKNPRIISDESRARLRRQIEKFQQLKPILVTTEGIVIGGNQRLGEYQALGIKEIWIAVKAPKDGAEQLEIALIDNDRAGETKRELLEELLQEFAVDTELIAVDFGESMLLTDIAKGIDIPDHEQEEPETSDDFTIVMKVPRDVYPKIKEALNIMQQEYAIETHIS